MASHFAVQQSCWAEKTNWMAFEGVSESDGSRRKEMPLSRYQQHNENMV